MFLDAMMTFLRNKGISSDEIANLEDYIEIEEFETDSIYMDASNEHTTSNIANVIDDEAVMMSITNFTHSNKS